MKSFSVGARVSHREHGDGMVTGTYGSAKFSVDFDNVGTKRVLPASLRLAAPMSAEALASVLRERDARRAKARAKYEHWQAEQNNKTEATALPKPEVFHADDFKLPSFDWKVIPAGPTFWNHWNAVKEGMKAPGFRVTKHAHDGSWMVCREAVPAPVSEPNQTTAQIIQFPVSRIVRHIRNGQPIADAGADAGNAAA
jgi:hypothetical protein